MKNNKSYHQTNIYIKVLADQLRRFSTNYFLMVESLAFNMLSGDIRDDIIQAFLELTNFFTIGAFDKIISEQNSSINDKQSNPNINFNELNDKGFIFINEDGQSLTIITCAPKVSNIYKKLDKLFNSSTKFGEDKETHLSIPDFTKMEKSEEYIQ